MSDIHWSSTFPLETPFHALALVVSLIAVIHVVEVGHTPYVSGIEMGIVFFLALGFVYAGWKISKTDLKAGGVARILTGTFFFGTIALVIAAFLISIRTASGVSVGDEAYVLFLAWTMGAAFGTPMIYFYERTQLQHLRLRESMEQSRDLAQQLSVNQRVLRHNIRNDLTVILGALESLSDSGDEQDDWAREAISTAANRLLATAEESVKIRRVLEEDAQFEFNLADTIRANVEEFDDIPATVDVNLDLPEPCSVIAHPSLPEAIEELLANAIEHNDAAELVVTFSVEERPEAADSVRLIVEDTGRGIPPDERQALIGKPETELDHATGLGLWLVRTIVDNSGGSIGYEDVEPSGARFVLDLPCT